MSLSLQKKIFSVAIECRLEFFLTESLLISKLAPRFPAVEFNCRNIIQRFGCVMLIVANVASRLQPSYLTSKSLWPQLALTLSDT